MPGSSGMRSVYDTRMRTPHENENLQDRQGCLCASRMLKHSASVRRLLFGLFGLSCLVGWLNETNQINNTNQTNHMNQTSQMNQSNQIRFGLVRLALAIIFLLTGFSTGCRLSQSAAEVPGQSTSTSGKKGKTLDPVELQQTMLRFADEFSRNMLSDIEKLRRGTNQLDPAEMLHWKLAFANTSYSIASGQNPIANLLDMTVFVTVTRMAVEEYWQPEVYGESGRPILESCRNAEADIWRLNEKVLTPDQQVELRQAIEAWRRKNPSPKNVLAARAVGFSTEVVQATQTDTTNPDSLLSLLSLDPLAGLEPATREIVQTRLMAERAFFVTQKMPTLLRWQMELLSANMVGMPAVQQLVTNSTTIAASAERFARVAEQLPGQVSTERKEILKALEAQESNLTRLLNEMRQTLTAGSQMSTSLNTTLATFDAMMTKQFGAGDPASTGPSKTDAEPFRIQDYTATAAQLEMTARQLTELLVTLDRTSGQLSAQVGPVVQQAQAGGQELVDYAFWKGILFVAIVLVACLIYRILGTRLASTTRSGNNSL